MVAQILYTFANFCVSNMCDILIVCCLSVIQVEFKVIAKMNVIMQNL